MWVNEIWESQDDVDKDIILFGEYNVPSVKDLDQNLNPVPATIIDWRKRMAANKKKPLNSDLEESNQVAYVVSGRGRGISDRVNRPGCSIEPHPSDDIELRKQIRQVSGMGYSNMLIEQSVRANILQNPIEIDSMFEMVPTGSSSRHLSSTKSPTKNKQWNSLSPN